MHALEEKPLEGGENILAVQGTQPPTATVALELQCAHN